MGLWKQLFGKKDDENAREITSPRVVGIVRRTFRVFISSTFSDSPPSVMRLNVAFSRACVPSARRTAARSRRSTCAGESVRPSAANSVPCASALKRSLAASGSHRVQILFA